MYRAKVYVTLKPGILDPQGEAVRKAIHALGYTGATEVRIGKYMELKLDGQDQSSVQQELQEICAKLLANPVIEDFRFEVTDCA